MVAQTNEMKGAIGLSSNEHMAVYTVLVEDAHQEAQHTENTNQNRAHGTRRVVESLWAKFWVDPS